MALGTVFWKLASPYDAYVSHVSRLNEAIDRIKYFTELTARQQAGIEASVRVGSGEAPDAAARAQLFRERISANAKRMSDEEFEDFIAVLGGGEAATVESARERALDRLGHATRGLEQYFTIAGQALATLEKRGYSPSRPDVARQLRENGLPQATLADYRHQLRDLGARA
ncbi:MAG: hypothetical protein IT303_17905 [Dehalococcoidia bacterium]|nr:hypothetical protein [Dehalococcoidia bacterium]